MFRLRTTVVLLTILLVVLSSRTASAFTSNSLTVQVYADGSVLVTQSLALSRSAGSVNVPLLASVLSDVVATDQNGSPLSWSISGVNITVYTLGATGVTLTYETLDLTNKTGTVWTVGFVTNFNTTVVLPKSSTITSISGTPYSLQVVDGSPVAAVSQGSWKISYGVPLGGQQTGTTNGTATSEKTSGTSTGTSGTPGGGTGGGPEGGILGLGQTQSDVVAALVVAVVAAALGFLWWRRRLDLGQQGTELRPDDVKVLAFIQEQGGKVLEPEIRMKFALPKTSGWRQIKRLERLGYVKVTKIGSQNQIELIKKREGS